MPGSEVQPERSTPTHRGRVARPTCPPRSVRRHASAHSPRTGRTLHLPAPLSEAPRIGGPLELASPRVLDQLQALQASQELGDLSLIGDARAFCDLAIARARVLA